MPKHDYMKLKLSLVEAGAEAHLLRIQMQQCGCNCKDSEFQAISDRLCKLLLYIQYKENLEKKKKGKPDNLSPSLHPTLDPGHPPTMRPFIRGQNNQKFCLFFCHSLVSLLTSFFCTISCILFQFFLSSILSPKHTQCIKPLQIFLLARFFGKFLLACC